jgi:hypothetical protein
MMVCQAFSAQAIPKPHAEKENPKFVIIGMFKQYKDTEIMNLYLIACKVHLLKKPLASNNLIIAEMNKNLELAE